MKPLELRRTLVVLGWSSRELSRRLKAHKTTVQRWLDGVTAVPDAVAAWLRDLRAAVTAHKPPKGW